MKTKVGAEEEEAEEAEAEEEEGAVKEVEVEVGAGTLTVNLAVILGLDPPSASPRLQYPIVDLARLAIL